MHHCPHGFKKFFTSVTPCLESGYCHHATAGILSAVEGGTLPPRGDAVCLREGHSAGQDTRRYDLEYNISIRNTENGRLRTRGTLVAVWYHHGRGMVP